MIAIVLAGCQDEPLNDPYPQFAATENILYTAFSSSPKHLDPAISYSNDEATFTYQIYEPPLQYHYLKRPYELIPLTTVAMPVVRYLDLNGNEVNSESEKVAFSIYRLQIKPNIFYQEHPAFAMFPGTSKYRYHALTPSEVKGKHTIQDFPYTGTRELIAEDYIYEIKRLADPHVNSPIYGVMENYIVGLKDFHEAAKKINKKDEKFLDLRTIPLAGVKLIDRYTYEITLQGKYAQFKHWLAMPFFAPIPWEVDKFYSQPLLQKRNITLDWFPVGTGPFVLAENNPNMMMVLAKNKNFHGETYPEEGEANDEALGYLKNKGKKLPFLDKIVFILEKESMPYWNKFLQGYYDQSGVTSSNFDQALKSMDENGIELSDELKQKGITYTKSVMSTVFYWGVNMLDPLVGGYSEKQKKLRKAISLVFDMKEFINIFLNGIGEVAQTFIPEGIFGHQKIMEKNKNDLEEAKKLLAQAGYPGGIDPKTHQPLSISLDIPAATNPDSAAQLAWFRKQFEKLGIELIVKPTQYSRFQDLLQNGKMQIFVFGWIADYPDPENFFFLLDSANGKVKFHGENATNYENKKFDEYFRQMKIMPDTAARQTLIHEMNDILKEDLPWIAAYFPTQISLRQQWVSPAKPNPIARNTLKYVSIDPLLREKCQRAWNQPILWPVWVMVLIIVLFCIPAFALYYIKTHRRLVLKNAQETKC